MDTICEDYPSAIHDQAKILDVVIVRSCDLVGCQCQGESGPDAAIYLHDLN
jgi:hypothetical protein